MAPSAVGEGFTMAVFRMFAFQLSDEQTIQKKNPDAAQKKIKKSERLANGNSEQALFHRKTGPRKSQK